MLISISVNGVHFTGLADTGASCTCVDVSVPPMFQLAVTPVAGKINTADVTASSSRIGTCDMTVSISTC